jgi:hypothetical protein
LRGSRRVKTKFFFKKSHKNLTTSQKKNKKKLLTPQENMNTVPVVYIGRGLTLEEVSLDNDPFADPLMIQNYQFAVAVSGDVLRMSTEVTTRDEAPRLAFMEAKNRLQSFMLLTRHDIENLKVELQEIIDEMSSRALTSQNIEAFSMHVAHKARQIAQKTMTLNAYKHDLSELGEEPSIVSTSFVYHIPHGQPVDLILPDGEAFPIIFFKACTRLTIKPEGPF